MSLVSASPCSSLSVEVQLGLCVFISSLETLLNSIWESLGSVLGFLHIDDQVTCKQKRLDFFLFDLYVFICLFFKLFAPLPGGSFHHSRNGSEGGRPCPAPSLTGKASRRRCACGVGSGAAAEAASQIEEVSLWLCF